MKKLLFSAALLTGGAVPAVGQVIQFTGLVVSGDSLVGVPDVQVSVPQTRRHTMTAPNGYFSLPVLAGDSIEVRAANSTVHLRVPLDYTRASYSLLVQIQPDARPTILCTMPASFSTHFLDLRLPSPPAVETPPISTKALLRPVYDNRGRRIR
jgi:hypothetical protein